MASKLEKTQQQYEALLMELAEKARMLEVFDKVSPEVQEKHRQAGDALADRKLELEFLQGELKQMDEAHDLQVEALEKELAQVTDQLDQKQGIAKVKDDKAAPFRKKLAGMEYDYKFAEKAQREERKKYERARRVEDHERARLHEENLKRIQIDLMKRQFAMNELKWKIANYEKPGQQVEKEAEKLEKLAEELTQKLKAVREGRNSEERQELERQLAAKEKEVARAELMVQDTLADAGEDLFERRVRHPVLSKMYEEMDEVAKVIDQLQQEAEKK